MEVTEILEFLHSGEQLAEEISTRHAKQAATRQDAVALLELKAKLEDGAMQKRITKLVKRALRKDKETNKPMFKEDYIRQVQQVEQLFKDLRERCSGSLSEELAALEATFQAKEVKAAKEKLRLREEERSRKEQAALEKAKEMEEQERAERERQERERQEQFEATAQRFEAMKDPLEVLRDQELVRMGNVTPGLNALGRALGLIEPKQRKSALKLLSETFLTNIVKSPDKKEFFRINVENPKFQSDVLGVKGATEVLIAIGFGIVLEVHEDEERMTVTKSLYYILGEPEIAPGEMDLDKLDEWERWYNRQKLYLAIVEHATYLPPQPYDALSERLASMSQADVTKMHELQTHEYIKHLKSLSSA